MRLLSSPRLAESPKRPSRATHSAPTTAAVAVSVVIAAAAATILAATVARVPGAVAIPAPSAEPGGALSSLASSLAASIASASASKKSTSTSSSTFSSSTSSSSSSSTSSKSSSSSSSSSTSSKATSSSTATTSQSSSKSSSTSNSKTSSSSSSSSSSKASSASSSSSKESSSSSSSSSSKASSSSSSSSSSKSSSTSKSTSSSSSSSSSKQSTSVSSTVTSSSSSKTASSTTSTSTSASASSSTSSKASTSSSASSTSSPSTSTSKTSSTTSTTSSKSSTSTPSTSTSTSTSSIKTSTSSTITSSTKTTTSSSSSKSSTKTTSSTALPSNYCLNTASSRSCWGEYNLTTNYYSTTPSTGVTRVFYLTLQRLQLSPDGFQRTVVAFNGTIPGPTLYAQWGDDIEIHLTNQLADNGTAIHVYGLRFPGASAADGIPGISQCPIAPGASAIYRFKADSYGLTYYAARFPLQMADGAFGPLRIDGPTAAGFDEDLPPMLVGDWLHQPATTAYLAGKGKAPTSPSGLVNGVGVFGTGGSYYQQTVQAGRRYRLGVANTGTTAHLKFSIDNHTLTVVAADSVPVQPYNVTVLDLGLAQRYDVVFTADQAAGNYWVRATPQTACAPHSNAGALRAILRYATAADTTATPVSVAYDADNECVDLTAALEPVVTVPFAAVALAELVDPPVALGAVTEVTWALGSPNMTVSWATPTLGQASASGASATYPSTANVVSLAGSASGWAVLHVTSASYNTSEAAPLHVHGHHWYLLIAGTGSFTGDYTDYLGLNLARRDSVLVPAGGYAVVAVRLDNPGVWLVEHAAGFRAAAGFALQLVERVADVPGAVGLDTNEWSSTCAAWATYAAANSPYQFG
ncbi:Lactose Permease, partial [Cladochytrium tenue]